MSFKQYFTEQINESTIKVGKYKLEDLLKKTWLRSQYSLKNGGTFVDSSKYVTMSKKVIVSQVEKTSTHIAIMIVRETVLIKIYEESNGSLEVTGTKELRLSNFFKNTKDVIRFDDVVNGVVLRRFKGFSRKGKSLVIEYTNGDSRVLPRYATHSDTDYKVEMLSEIEQMRNMGINIPESKVKELKVLFSDHFTDSTEFKLDNTVLSDVLNHIKDNVVRKFVSSSMSSNSSHSIAIKPSEVYIAYTLGINTTRENFKYDKTPKNHKALAKFLESGEVKQFIDKYYKQKDIYTGDFADYVSRTGNYD